MRNNSAETAGIFRRGRAAFPASRRTAAKKEGRIRRESAPPGPAMTGQHTRGTSSIISPCRPSGGLNQRGTQLSPFQAQFFGRRVRRRFGWRRAGPFDSPWSACCKHRRSLAAEAAIVRATCHRDRVGMRTIRNPPRRSLWRAAGGTWLSQKHCPQSTAGQVETLFFASFLR